MLPYILHLWSWSSDLHTSSSFSLYLLLPLLIGSLFFPLPSLALFLEGFKTFQDISYLEELEISIETVGEEHLPQPLLEAEQKSQGAFPPSLLSDVRAFMLGNYLQPMNCLTLFEPAASGELQPPETCPLVAF